MIGSRAGACRLLPRRHRATTPTAACLLGLRRLTGSGSSSHGGPPPPASPPPHHHHHGGHQHHEPWAFDADTAITTLGEHLYKGHVTNRWSVGDAPNGGYLMSLAISAARKELRFRDPLSVSVHFTAKAVQGAEAELRVDVLHSGRTSQTAQVWLRQEGGLRSVYLLTFGDLKAFKGLDHLAPQLTAPDLPPVSECLNVSAALTRASHTRLSIYERVEFRMARDSPFVTSALRGVADAGGRAVLEGWAAFADGRPPCLRSMALFNDAYPPPVLCLSPATPWVPTTELTLHCWTRPTPSGVAGAGQWLRVRFVTDVVRGGLLRCDGEVWSADGSTLHATSRQLARLLSPRGQPQAKGGAGGQQDGGR